MNSIDSSFQKLKTYIENEGYKGHDPYDALKSPFFKLPILKSNKPIRFGTQQLVKRLPFSIRPLLFVPKGFNPVALGLSIQAYAYLFQTDPDNKSTYLSKLDYLIGELKKLIPDGFSGACWGYDFDWEARHAKIQAYQPTVVATGIITNALYIAYQITGHQECAKLVNSAARFVLSDLKRSYKGDSFCFSYSPNDEQRVFNASMKGVRVLAQSYSLSNNKELKETSKHAVDFVLNNQNENGSWGYSLANSGSWSDNYHTGYVLDCLDEYVKLTEDKRPLESIQKGYDFYKDHFITQEGIPRFYHNKTYPIDCTAASQTILTSILFGDKETAIRVANWMTQNMQKENGSFYFRKFKHYKIKTSFMRWSDAWMFTALSNLQLIQNEDTISS
jgi:hypothetical protein